ncbi:CRISPR-associated endonuclease Cas1, partial [bacterium]|nr:CRISPR-associated endonuclease Cas1 [bacterium]
MNDLRSFITNAIDLAITTHGVALYKSGESLVVSKDKKLIKQVPIRRISSVTLFTDRVRLTGAAINL